MPRNWKSALYEYARLRNRAAAELAVEPLRPLVRDESFMERQVARLIRIREGRADRGASSGKHETGLRFRVLSERDRDVRVQLDLRTRWQYRIAEIDHQEEKWERQVVTLSLRRGQWYVSRVEEAVPERRSEADGLFWIAPFDPGQSVPETPFACRPSRPFLNMGVLGGAVLPPRAPVYDREKARAYAEQWWNTPNPAFETFEVNCTNFVSQCLFAGGAPMNYTGKRESGWWYEGKTAKGEHWSYSWAVANSLQLYLSRSVRGLRGETAGTAAELNVGDVIFYDWDGNGRFQHSVIVTARDANGQPLVNANTSNSRLRYWDYRDSPAWTERTRYRFVRIADEF